MAAKEKLQVCTEDSAMIQGSHKLKQGNSSKELQVVIF